MYLLAHSLECSMHKIHVSEIQPEIENVQKPKQKKEDKPKQTNQNGKETDRQN